MLTNTFLHIPQVGEERERHLWEKGVIHWNDIVLENNSGVRRTLKNSFEYFKKHVIDSLYHYENKNTGL